MGYKLRQNPAHPNNYQVGRSQKINKVVIHHAATTDFDGIARTFQNPNRQASAHYGVGRNNNVDQYVAEGNTAWHAGTSIASGIPNPNPSSIGIENVNASGAPEWAIAESTFNTLVELVADVVKRNGLGKLVVGKNLFQHKNFAPTYCAGKLGDRLQELADRVNAGVSGGATPVPAPARRSNEQIATEVLAGAWGNNPERKNRLEAQGYNYAAIQAIVNSRVGGGAPAPAPARPSNDEIANQVLAGAWGNNPSRQQRLQAAGYDYAAIQALVNKKLGGGSSAPARKSEEQVANEIIAGVGGWGNNPQRREKLQAAGYNASAVQAIVNRKLGF